jgi:aromatic-L-amino-acid decarboxylase
MRGIAPTEPEKPQPLAVVKSPAGRLLGRRFRAHKLWFVIRAYGIGRLQAMLREHVAWTAELAAQIDAAPDFELTTPANRALLTFRYRPAGLDESALETLNEHLLHALNDSGRLYLTQTRVRGSYVIRVAIGQRTTHASTCSGRGS